MVISNSILILTTQLWYDDRATQIEYLTYTEDVFLFRQKRILRFAFSVEVKDLCSNKWSYAFFGV